MRNKECAFTTLMSWFLLTILKKVWYFCIIQAILPKIPNWVRKMTPLQSLRMVEIIKAHKGVINHLITSICVSFWQINLQKLHVPIFQSKITKIKIRNTPGKNYLDRYYISKLLIRKKAFSKRDTLVCLITALAQINPENQCFDVSFFFVSSSCWWTPRVS